MELIKALEWRYATKKMTKQVVIEDHINHIIKAIDLAPTSSGLQPFEVFIITNSTIKEQLLPIAFNQSQIIDASHVLVFAAWDHYTEERIDKSFSYMNKQRDMPDSTTDDYVRRLKHTLFQWTDDEQHHHAAKQAYIAFALAMAAAAELRVDTVPIEGFNKTSLDKLLNLRERGLKSCLILPLGYRDQENDWLFPLKKIRKPLENLITRI